MEPADGSWKPLFQVAEWPHVHTGSLGPCSSRDEFLMPLPSSWLKCPCSLPQGSNELWVRWLPYKITQVQAQSVTEAWGTIRSPGSSTVLTIAVSCCIFKREVSVCRLSVQVFLLAFSFLDCMKDTLPALGWGCPARKSTELCSFLEICKQTKWGT